MEWDNQRWIFGGGALWEAGGFRETVGLWEAGVVFWVDAEDA